MPGAKTYKLEQVSVRLKLMEEAPLYSTDKIDTPDRAIEIMSEMMKTLDREHVCVVNLDGAAHPINFNVVSVGSINASPVAMRELFKTAILQNASNILMLHNHPSSSITPSREDHAVTARVLMASEMMGIPLVDHIIVGGGAGEYFSYKKELKGMFNLDGIKTFLKINGIDGVFAEAAAEYRVDDLGPKRVVEDKPKGSGITQEYKPLAKVEEIEEENYNQIDNYLSNTKPKEEEIREKRQIEADKRTESAKDRPSILAQMRKKKAIIEARKSERKLQECESKAERIV